MSVKAVPVIGAATMLSGWWALSAESEVTEVNELWEIVLDRDNGMINRRTAHVATGAGIVVLLLVMAVVSRFLAGRRVVISFFALLLIAVVTAQIWFGSLLMFDLAEGSLRSFTRSAAAMEKAAEKRTPDPDATTAPASAPATTSTAPAE